LILPLNCSSQSICGKYGNPFGESLLLIENNRFEFDWRFDLSGSWSTGTWIFRNDTVYLNLISIFDTLKIYNDEGSLIKDTLVLSMDEIPSTISIEEHIISQISGGGQNRRLPPAKLILKKNRLYFLLENGKLDRRRIKGILSHKKHKTYFRKVK
jgi:hypothetical protein